MSKNTSLRAIDVQRETKQVRRKSVNFVHIFVQLECMSMTGCVIVNTFSDEIKVGDVCVEGISCAPGCPG